MKPNDHTGTVYGRLTALRIAPKRGTRTFWLFSCQCGNTKEIHVASVVSGAVKSCGCLHLERCATGNNRRRHGDAKVGAVARLHSIWRGMLKRCNPLANRFATSGYASRGIKYDPAWSNYQSFKAWALANGYSDDLTIDRINNDGHYSAENCRWTTHKEQCRNRRNTVWIEFGGERKCLAEWLEQTGVTRSAYSARVARGWSIPMALCLVG